MLLLPLCAGGGFVLIGPARVYTWIAGPADQGAVDFATLQRRSTPTDSLACTPGLCRSRIDLSLPVYAEPPEQLMQRLDAVVLADARNLTRVDDQSRPAYRRYVARTAAMRFPDTIDAEARPFKGGTGLMLYGRSQLGVGDWGVNRARQEGWIARLGDPSAPHPALPTS